MPFLRQAGDLTRHHSDHVTPADDGSQWQLSRHGAPACTSGIQTTAPGRLSAALSVPFRPTPALSLSSLCRYFSVVLIVPRFLPVIHLLRCRFFRVKGLRLDVDIKYKDVKCKQRDELPMWGRCFQCIIVLLLIDFLSP